MKCFAECMNSPKTPMHIFIAMPLLSLTLIGGACWTVSGFRSFFILLVIIQKTRAAIFHMIDHCEIDDRLKYWWPRPKTLMTIEGAREGLWGLICFRCWLGDVFFCTLVPFHLYDLKRISGQPNSFSIVLTSRFNQ